jgi:urease accessory protein
VSLAARAGAIVEWLPLETIVFDEADAESVLTVDLEGAACAAGWEIVVFGRAAMGERFERGRFRQRIELRRDGRLRWAECGDVAGGDPLFNSPIGFADCTVSGVLWIVGAPPFDARAALAEEPVGSQGAGDIAVTRIDEDVLLARAIGNSSEQVKQSLTRAWHAWRPHYADRRVRAPRLWAT